MTTKPVVPKPSDSDVREWLEVNAMQGTPECIPYEDHGYEARFCHVSAKHHAITNGGKRVHGWALWRWAVPDADLGTTIIFAEHHSVWEMPDGKLIDLTPPASGGASVLFVRDDSATIVSENGHFRMHTDRTNWRDLPRVLQGKPTPQEFYALNPAKPDLKAYSERLGFEISRMATDTTHG